MPKIRYTYCDANVFLAYFNAESTRINTLDQLFESVQKDPKRKIVTSVVSITEVSHVADEKNRNRLDPKIYTAIDGFWGDASLIEFVDFNELIARQARDLIRQAISLKYTLHTNDAIHLISARYVGASECFTYDQKLYKFASIAGYDIREPFVDTSQPPFVSLEDPSEE
jgi:predicted nucleic acid-binding protein